MTLAFHAMLASVLASDSSSESVASVGTRSLLATLGGHHGWRTGVAWVSSVSSQRLVCLWLPPLPRGSRHWSVRSRHGSDPSGRSLACGAPAIRVDRRGAGGHSPLTSSTSTAASTETAVSTGGEDEPDGDGDGDRRGDGIKRTRVEEKPDVRMSTVTATMNKIDDCRVLQKTSEA